MKYNCDPKWSPGSLSSSRIESLSELGDSPTNPINPENFSSSSDDFSDQRPKRPSSVWLMRTDPGSNAPSDEATEKNPDRKYIAVSSLQLPLQNNSGGEYSSGRSKASRHSSSSAQIENPTQRQPALTKLTMVQSASQGEGDSSGSECKLSTWE